MYYCIIDQRFTSDNFQHNSCYVLFFFFTSVFGACPVKDACLGVPDILDSSTGEVLSVKPLDPGDKEQFERCREGHLQTSELCVRDQLDLS